MKRRRWVDWLLGVYPEPFRRAHGSEIAEHVDETLRAAGVRRPWVACTVALDLLRGALRLRVRPAGPQLPVGSRWGGLGSDLRVTVRTLLKQPGFSGVVVGTLALGVGMNAALFSLLEQTVFQPFDYEDPDRLVYLSAEMPVDEISNAHFSGGDLRDLREVGAFEGVEGVALIRQNLHGAGLPRQVAVGWASGGFLELLGVEPELGRLHTPDDPPGTLVLSSALWSGAFDSDPDVLGRSVQLDGHPYTVVGVLPAGFEAHLPWSDVSPPDIEVWKNPDNFWQNGDPWGAQGPEFSLVQVVGRLRPDAALVDAQAGVDRVGESLRARFPAFEEAGFHIVAHDLHDRVVANARPLLVMLAGSVLAVLLIGCANVAGLLLVRGHRRRREIGLRVALGCSTARVGRLLMMESATLAAAGSCLGLALALWAVGMAPRWAPSALPRLDELAMDITVVAFCGGLAVLVTLLVGVVPSWIAVRGDPGLGLQSARVAGTGGGAVRRTLVVGQIATSLVLLVSAALLLGSTARLQRVQPGFDASDVFTFGVSIPGTQYGWPEEAGAFYRDVETHVAALPGVEAAGVVWPMPFAGSWSSPVLIEEDERRDLGQASYRLTTEQYFPTMRIPLQEGRLFREGDRREVAVVSRSLAERAWPGRSPIGLEVLATPWGGDPVSFEVIGVVGDVRYRDLREPPEGAIYFDARSWSWVDWEVHVLVRSAVAPTALVPALRSVVAEVDPTIPLAHPAPLADGIAQQTARPRFVLTLLLAFAGSAALLAVVGLYGAISYAVGLRRREFGVRVALGSGRSGIRALVLRESGRLIAIGVALGLLGAVAASSALEAMLFEVSGTDPATYVGAALLLGCAALAATWVPAWRVGRMDPVVVLRND
ncbi:MAG: ABC transporter permease [Gemmatimonadota bacterium]